ncbi:hypothetical protein K1Y78_62570, partial [Streptomyces sp. tea 10]|nr:hypothetical protein [Streptomyces sp. tea 10]
MSPSASQSRVAASAVKEPAQEPEQESGWEPEREGDRKPGRESGEGGAGSRSRAADRSGTVRKGLALLEMLAEYPHGATAGQLVAD